MKSLGMKLRCDEKYCDYICEIPVEDAEYNVNRPCPKCGKNMLTEEDYKAFVKLRNTCKIVDFCLGWLNWIPFVKLRETKIRIESDGQGVVKASEVVENENNNN